MKKCVISFNNCVHAFSRDSIITVKNGCFCKQSVQPGLSNCLFDYCRLLAIVISILKQTILETQTHLNYSCILPRSRTIADIFNRIIFCNCYFYAYKWYVSLGIFRYFPRLHSFSSEIVKHILDSYIWYF